MQRFEVWAPFAKKMAVCVNGTILLMNSADKLGWWWIEADDIEPGSDYGFYIDDDKKCYPDPRSQWQPNGVHGLSRVYAQDAFKWADQKFQAPPLEAGVIYELHIGTFTAQSTLDAAITKLDHLINLGITHVELMPVASFVGRHGWGYDGVALFAVHEPYGGPDALKRFVNAAHEKGLSVLLDVVYNHFGPVGNYTGKFGPYLIDTHHTPWGGAVNLEDAESQQVRNFFCDNARMWMRDYHIDGLRIDAVHSFIDRSAIHFLEQLATEVETLGAALARRLVLIAESDLNDPRIVTPREVGGFGMDAQWSDDFHHSLFTLLNSKEVDGYYKDFGSLAYLAKALEKTFVYDGVYSGYRKRVHGRPVGSLSQHRFVGYIQTHDQVGNRAIGDRISAIVGVDRAKIAAAIVLMSPFIPMLFQGEEWATSSPFQYFADYDDPEMARLISADRKKEFSAFGWDHDSIPDPSDHATFERSKLNWDEVTQREYAEMLEWYRALIQLRRTIPSLNNGEPGNTRVTYEQEGMWFSMERGQVTVDCNLGTCECTFLLPKKSHIVLASREGISIMNESVILPPNTVAIILNTRTLVGM